MQRLTEATEAYTDSQRAAVAPAAARMFAGMRTASALEAGGRVALTCYRIVRDSLTSRTVIPERFALERREPAQAVANPVRMVDSSGRVGAVIGSATWQAANEGTAVITWSSTEPREMLRLTGTNGGVVAAAIREGIRVPVHVVATPCRF